MNINGKIFFREAYKVLKKLEKTQMKKIKKASKVISDSIKNDGVVHIFGAGHSQAFGMELAGRAGGLAMMNPMKLDDLVTLADDPVSYEERRDPSFERNPENGLNVMNLHNIKSQDVIMVCSNSGRNGAVVEVALEAKRRSLPLIGVTSMNHSQKTESRHPDEKKLYEIADIVIDNCGPYGDALLDVPEMEADVCSISSITNAFIAQSLNAEIIGNLLEEDIKPPVFISYNVDGADEHNQKLKDKYEDRVNV